jgi:hypothetical protein
MTPASPIPIETAFSDLAERNAAVKRRFAARDRSTSSLRLRPKDKKRLTYPYRPTR